MHTIRINAYTFRCIFSPALERARSLYARTADRQPTSCCQSIYAVRSSQARPYYRSQS